MTAAAAQAIAGRSHGPAAGFLFDLHGPCAGDLFFTQVVQHVLA
jgi:hypothetical protein